MLVKQVSETEMRQVSNRETETRPFCFKSKVSDCFSCQNIWQPQDMGSSGQSGNKLRGNGKLTGNEKKGLGIRKWKSTRQNTCATPQSHVRSREGQEMNAQGASAMDTKVGIPVCSATPNTVTHRGDQVSHCTGQESDSGHRDKWQSQDSHPDLSLLILLLVRNYQYTEEVWALFLVRMN